MAKLLVLHGPNLNLLGIREPAHYGHERLEDINNMIILQAREHSHQVVTFQSNAEHQLIDRIHRALHEGVDCIIFNPAAYTHTSVALRDALLSVNIPFIEVHLTNITTRESFRQTSYFSDIAIGTITGFGAQGYTLAVTAAHHHLAKTTHPEEV